MSNQSGIVASNQLRSFFGSCRDGRVRLVKVGAEFHIFLCPGFMDTP